MVNTGNSLISFKVNKSQSKIHIVKVLQAQNYIFTISKGDFISCLYCTFRPNKYISVGWTRSNFL